MARGDRNILNTFKNVLATIWWRYRPFVLTLIAYSTFQSWYVLHLFACIGYTHFIKKHVNYNFKLFFSLFALACLFFPLPISIVVQGYMFHIYSACKMKLSNIRLQSRKQRFWNLILKCNLSSKGNCQTVMCDIMHKIHTQFALLIFFRSYRCHRGCQIKIYSIYSLRASLV